jgi:enoyl-CoA hydratase/carnithine racemase
MTDFAGGDLRLDLHGDHAELTINRPAKRNAITLAMWLALPNAAAAFAASPAKVLVLRGAEGHFAAGADIGEFETTYATRESAAAYGAAVAGGVSAIANLAKPTLALIEGACVGGGLAIALACDLRLAADNARLAITPAKLGLSYSLEDTKRLVDVVGPSAAKDILFTGRLVVADEALRLGLLDAVHPAEVLGAAVRTKAAAIATASQHSVRGIKATVAMILSGRTKDDEATRAAFVASTEGPDFQEGRAAFLEKRSPVFPVR